MLGLAKRYALQIVSRALVLASSVILAEASAQALEPEVTSETAAQFYDVRSPTGETVLHRRRLTTTLGVSAYDLMDKPQALDPSAPTLSFRARLRYDADYGASPAESDETNFGRVIPGYSRGPVDLMYGYVEGRRFLKGWLSFRVGRQYVTDALGWWSFDGGQVKVTTPYYVAVEATGGLEVRGGMPLSTPRFERDGIWRGNRSGYDPSLHSAFQPSDVAPAYGAAIESAGFPWLHGRLTYRRVYNTGASNVSEFSNGLTQPATYRGTRISQERVGYAMDGTIATLGGFKAGIAYDLYNARVPQAFASIDVFATQRLTLSADYDFYQPTFDADSIWNVFAASPMNDIGLRASLDATDKITLSGGGHARIFAVQTEAEALSSPTSPLAAQNVYPSSGAELAGGGDLSARYHWGEGHLGARGAADFGKQGDRLGVDVFGERTLETRFVLQGRVGGWQWKDQLRPDRHATSVGYVAGLGYKLWRRSLVLADFEHNVNRIEGQRFRLMLWLSVAVTK